MKFREKPTAVDAVRVTAEFLADKSLWPEWLLEATAKPPSHPGAVFPTPGHESKYLSYRYFDGRSAGSRVVPRDGWIILGEHQVIWALPDHDFRIRYEAIPE